MEEFPQLDFVFNNDIITSRFQIMEYGLRSIGSVDFISDKLPLFEVNVFMNPESDYFDPLLALVYDFDNTVEVKLYFCHRLGSDYIELANYGAFDDAAEVRDQLLKYYETKELSKECLDLLKSSFNKCVTIIEDKIKLIRSI